MAEAKASRRELMVAKTPSKYKSARRKLLTFTVVVAGQDSEVTVMALFEGFVGVGVVVGVKVGVWESN